MADTGIETQIIDDDTKSPFDANKTTEVYIYKLPNVTKDDPFFKKNSHVIFTASTSVVEDFTTPIINGIVITEDGENISNGTSTSTLSKILRRSKRPYIYTNDYKGKFSNEAVYIAVVGEPLDVAKADARQQSIFYISNINSTAEAPDDTTGILDAESLTTLELESWTLNEDQFLNAKSYWTIDPTYNSQSTSRIILELQKQSLINSLLLRGKTANGLTSNVPITTTSQLVPIIFNPIEDQDKLVMYSPWFDYDFALPFFNAKEFTTAQSISKILTQEKQQKLLLDLLLVSYAYAADFSFVDYVTEGNDAGKIKGDQYIGYTAKQASSLTNKTPLAVIDSIFEEYLRINPQDETSDELRFIQQAISALSRFIQSSKAIGKGNNSFNKVYLPFNLRPFGQLKPEKVGVPNPTGTGANVQSWVLVNSKTKFSLISLYFGEAQGEIINDQQQLLDELKVVQLDRKTTLPFLADTITAINKLPLPGDIDTKSAKDIKYLFYTNIDSTKLNEFFALNKTIKTAINKGTTITGETSAFSPYGKIYPNTEAGKKQLFNDLGYSQEYKSADLETIPSDLKSEFFTYTADLKSTSFVAGNYALFSTPDLDSSGTLSKEEFAAGLGLDPNAIIDYVETRKNSGSAADGTLRSTITYEYKLLHSRLTDLSYVVSTSSGINISALERKTIFDKHEWKKEIDNFSKNPTNPDLKYSIEFNSKDDIIKLEELIIRQIWGEEITLHINGLTKTLLLHNKEDETIGVERILFR